MLTLIVSERFTIHGQAILNDVPRPINVSSPEEVWSVSRQVTPAQAEQDLPKQGITRRVGKRAGPIACKNKTINLLKNSFEEHTVLSTAKLTFDPNCRICESYGRQKSDRSHPPQTPLEKSDLRNLRGHFRIYLKTSSPYLQERGVFVQISL